MNYCELVSFLRRAKCQLVVWHGPKVASKVGSISDLLRTHTRNMSRRWRHNSKPKTNEAPAVMSDRGFEVA